MALERVRWRMGLGIGACADAVLFGLGSLWQYEANWLQRLGAAALGFALAQYVMIAVGFSALEI